MAEAIARASELKSKFAEYLAETRRPLVCLAFLSPILIIYELGVLSQSGATARNGADVLLRRLLDGIGLEFSLLLPIAICGILLALHHLSGEAWRLNAQTLIGMTGECIAFGSMLLVVAHVQQVLMSGSPGTAEITHQIHDSTTQVDSSPFQHFISYLGAGLYEELLFRLLMLTLFVWIANRLLGSQKQAIVVGVLATSLLFVAAHYQPLNPAGYEFTLLNADALYGLSFRFLAGVFFALLYLRRGFGVAVGAHAAYDLLIHFT